MKDKILFLTSDEWWDTNITVYPIIQNYISLKVIVLSYSKNNKYPQKKIDGNIDLIEYKLKYRKRDPRNLVTAFKIWCKILSLSDHKFVYEYFFDIYLNMFMSIKMPKESIITFHNYVLHSDANIFEKIYRKIFLNKVNRFHFYSLDQYHLFNKEKNIGKEASYTLMPIKDYGPPVNEQDKITGETHLLFFGIIRDYKNLKLLIKAIQEINNPLIKLTIAGYSNDWNEKYLPLIQDNRCFNLLIRFIDNEEIPDLFSNADYLVLPYTDTTQSGPLFIAYNYSLPIIASDIPIFKTYVNNGLNGFVFENNNLQSLKQTILFSHAQNMESRLKMIENAKTISNEYTIKSNDSIHKFVSWI